MGCVPDDGDCGESEKPRHPVTLTGSFDLMKTEVTLGMFRTYATAAGKAVPVQQVWSVNPRQPILSVTWDESVAFCSWLGGRLPSEAEWEYAARGGQDGAKYVWGNVPRPELNGRPVANVADESALRKSPGGRIIPGYEDGYSETAPVGSFVSSAFGLHDMAGNVWEWVADWYGPYSDGLATDPHGPTAGNRHVARGGSWTSVLTTLRVSYRNELAPGPRYGYVGFRCARDVSP